MSTESLLAGVRTVVTGAPTQVRILQLHCNCLHCTALHANLHECGFHAREVQLLPAQTGLLLLNEVGAGGGVGVGRGTRPGEPLDHGITEGPELGRHVGLAAWTRCGESTSRLDTESSSIGQSVDDFSAGQIRNHTGHCAGPAAGHKGSHLPELHQRGRTFVWVAAAMGDPNIPFDMIPCAVAWSPKTMSMAELSFRPDLDDEAVSLPSRAASTAARMVTA
jgi:hypothetical protein